MGQRASDTCALRFTDLEIADDARIGDEGQGYKIALASLETGRIGIASQSVGMAQAALDAAIAYAKDRLQGRAATGPENPDDAADPLIVHPDIRRNLMQQF